MKGPLNVDGNVHATGNVTGDLGLSTTLGGVDTNYVNVNNPEGGIRWPHTQILSGEYDPNTPLAGSQTAAAPVGSVFIGTGGFYRKTDPATWTRLG